MTASGHTSATASCSNCRRRATCWRQRQLRKRHPAAVATQHSLASPSRQQRSWLRSSALLLCWKMLGGQLVGRPVVTSAQRALRASRHAAAAGLSHSRLLVTSHSARHPWRQSQTAASWQLTAAVPAQTLRQHASRWRTASSMTCTTRLPRTSIPPGDPTPVPFLLSTKEHGPAWHCSNDSA